MANPSFLVNARLAAIAEGTPGTLSGAGTWNILPITTDGFSINPTKNVTEAPIVDATRQKSSTVAGSYETRVSISTAVNNEPGFRFLLESALFSTFSTDTIVAGATRKTFSLELKNELGATDYYRRVAGCVVDTLSIEAQEGGFLKATWGILGEEYTAATSEIGSTYTAISGYEGMASVLSGTSVTYNSAALAGVTNFSLNISNGLGAQFAMGSAAPDHLTVDAFRLEGSGSYYLRDNTIATPFISEVADDLVVVFSSSDASPIKNTLTITIPKAKFTQSNVIGQKTVSDDFRFLATYDSGITSKVQMVFSAV